MPVWIVLLLALPVVVAASEAEPRVVIGVLEAERAALDSDVHGAVVDPASGRHARILFHSDHTGGWAAYPHEVGEQADLAPKWRATPEHLRWQVYADGACVAPLLTDRPARWLFYCDIGLHRVAAGQTIPLIGHASERFLTGNVSRPAWRPLVLVNRVAVTDPEGWSRDHAVPEAVMAACRKRAGMSSQAKVAQAYSSRSGERLVTIQIIDPPHEGPDQDSCATFLIDADGRIHHLGFDLRLVDAGDFDGDGHSELLLFTSGYNLDGYVLVWDGRQKQAEFSWSYH